MTFSAEQVNSQLDSSLSANALLLSSCHAFLEATKAPKHQSEELGAGTRWGEKVFWEIEDARTYIYCTEDSYKGLSFDGEVLDDVASCAATFSGLSGEIEKLLTTLEGDFDEAVKKTLVARFHSLMEPVAAVSSRIYFYLYGLRESQECIGKVQKRMQATIDEAQTEEAEIEEEIVAINRQISMLEKQVETDRKAIAAARAEESKGRVETIFGVLLAPLTDGTSLIFAGIGVATIVEAQDAVDKLESTISGFQRTIAGEQEALGDDQRSLATLKGLTLSIKLLSGDIGNIEEALKPLRQSWTSYHDDLEGTVRDLEQASDANTFRSVQVQYRNACAEWKLVTEHVASITVATSTKKVTIG